MLVLALIDTLFPVPGVKVPLPTNVKVVVGDPLIVILVVGPEIVD